jgi:hypothetical protein
MKLFILLLLLSNAAWSQKTISSGTFQGTVRPIVTGMINDFYNLVSKFPEFPHEFAAIMDETGNLLQPKLNLLTDCPAYLTKNCLSSLQELQGRLSKIDGITLKLLANQKMSESLHLNSLNGMRFLYQFQAALASLKGTIENTTFLIKAELKPSQKSYPLVKKIDELRDLAGMALVEHVPYAYKEDFRHFYLDFVFPLETELPKVSNYEYMNRNVRYLNFTFNLLKMNLTKKNKKTPEGMGPLLESMHNRWNSAVRVYY